MVTEGPRDARVSVIIPAYNAAPWIADALRSVRAQTHPTLEVLVVDNGSTDATVAVARDADRDVRVLHASTRGPSAAKNVGLDAATGEFVQFLDADDFLEPGKIARHVAAAERTGADVVWGGFERLTPLGDALIAGPTLVPRLDEGDVLRSLIAPDGFLPLAAAMFRRDSAVSRLRFDERRMVVEDVQWLIAVAAAGVSFAQSDGVPGLRVREHDSAGRASRVGDAPFFRACAENASAVAAIWRQRGEPITAARREALVSVWLYSAEMLGRAGDAGAEAVLAEARAYDPAAFSRLGQPLRTLARVAGFGRGARCAHHLSQARARLRGALAPSRR